MRKYRAASNRSTVRVARDAGGPHPAVHMFGRLKSHFFCLIGLWWSDFVIMQHYLGQLAVMKQMVTPT
jgi:hypothetical protein